MAVGRSVHKLRAGMHACLKKCNHLCRANAGRCILKQLTSKSPGQLRCRTHSALVTQIYGLLTPAECKYMVLKARDEWDGVLARYGIGA